MRQGCGGSLTLSQIFRKETGTTVTSTTARSLDALLAAHTVATMSPLTASPPPSLLATDPNVILKRLWTAANAPDNNLGVSEVGPSPQRLTKARDAHPPSCFNHLIRALRSSVSVSWDWTRGPASSTLAPAMDW